MFYLLTAFACLLAFWAGYVWGVTKPPEKPTRLSALALTLEILHVYRIHLNRKASVTLSKDRRESDRVDVAIQMIEDFIQAEKETP